MSSTLISRPFPWPHISFVRPQPTNTLPFQTKEMNGARLHHIDLELKLNFSLSFGSFDEIFNRSRALQTMTRRWDLNE